MAHSDEQDRSHQIRTYSALADLWIEYQHIYGLTPARAKLLMLADLSLITEVDTERKAGDTNLWNDDVLASARKLVVNKVYGPFGGE